MLLAHPRDCGTISMYAINRIVEHTSGLYRLFCCGNRSAPPTQPTPTSRPASSATGNSTREQGRRRETVPATVTPSLSSYSYLSHGIDTVVPRAWQITGTSLRAIRWFVGNRMLCVLADACGEFFQMLGPLLR